MTGFVYTPIFPLARDAVRYRKLAGDFVRPLREGRLRGIRVSPRALAALAEEAFHDASFYYAPDYLRELAGVASDPGGSENDRYVARLLLHNAVTAAGGALPLCQDTGTATIMAARGRNVWTSGDDARWLSLGVHHAYTRYNLRPSQMAPQGMFEERNTGNNLPALIDIQAVPGSEYRFLFVAKGGGSANKMALYQESKALLSREERLLDFFREKLRALGVAACPPYHIAVVIGGLAAEMTLKTVKLASAGALDGLVTEPTGAPHAYRDLDWEAKLGSVARELGLGAQFGGLHFALDVRVIRMPRHAGSLPVGIGVSCNAHRNIRGKITRSGVFLEKLERRPSRFLPLGETLPPEAEGVRIDLDRPIEEVLADLSRHAPGTRLRLTGTLIVARDIAHIRLKEMLDRNGKLPDYFRAHPVYYAGPARTPEGMVSGSFGPTTAQRMDAYVPEFMAQGASRIMLAKGNRSPAIAEACRKYKGFYLGAVGGAAAWVARECILASEIVDFPDLGMEAIRRIRVRDLPAFIIGDHRGRTLYDA